MSTPSNETVVETAAVAAEEAIFEAYGPTEVRDVDVTVTFEEGVLEVDVYLNAGGDEREQDVADAAVEAATRAVDELFGPGSTT